MDTCMMTRCPERFTKSEQETLYHYAEHMLPFSSLIPKPYTLNPHTSSNVAYKKREALISMSPRILQAQGCTSIYLNVINSKPT